MKTLRKTIPFMLLVASAFTTSGCSMYTSKADTLENIVGFYELAVWEGKKEASDEDTYDRKAEEGTVAYFTIDKDGYCYYGFKDNKTEAWVKPAYATYSHDDDEPELYKAVSIQGKVDTVYAWEKTVGCLDEPVLGFKRQEVVVEERKWPLKDKTEMRSTLAYTIPWHEYTWYNPHKIQKYQYVEYRRISNETGYKVINEKLGTNFEMKVPYEIYGLDGYWVYRCQPKDGSGLDSRGIYEYAVLDMGSYSNGKLTVTYSLKSSPGRQTVQVPVNVVEMGRSYSITFNDKAFNGTGIGCATDQASYPDSSKVLDESFSMFYSSDLSLNEIIDREKEPAGPYVVHNIVSGSKEYASMTQDYYTGVCTIEGLTLKANEEFAIKTNEMRYFEDYVDDGTAHDKVVVGNKAGTRWTLEDGDVDVHYLKATEAGTYDITVDSTGKIQIVH